MSKRIETGQNHKSLWSIILLIMTCIFIALLIMLSFFLAEEKYKISTSDIILLFLLVILVLSDKFTSFSIFKDMLKISANNENEIINMDDIEKKEQNEEIEENTKSEKSIHKRIDNEKFRTMILKKLFDDRNINKIVYDIKVVEKFQNIDSISNKPVYFDAYLEESNQETFILIRSFSYSVFMLHDRLYVQLNKLQSYKSAKNIDVVLLLLVGKPKKDSGEKFEDIEKYFAPAIKNGLLKIKYIDFDDIEYESCFKTIK